MFHGLRLGLAALSSLSAVACANHVRLAVPATTGSSLYICDKGACRPSEVDDPKLFNQSGTVFVKLPEQCQARFHEIVVIDADSSNPQVFARCAPPEETPRAEPIPVMGEEGAVPPTPAPAATPSGSPSGSVP